MCHVFPKITLQIKLDYLFKFHCWFLDSSKLEYNCLKASTIRISILNHINSICCSFWYLQHVYLLLIMGYSQQWLWITPNSIFRDHSQLCLAEPAGSRDWTQSPWTRSMYSRLVCYLHLIYYSISSASSLFFCFSVFISISFYVIFSLPFILLLP